MLGLRLTGADLVQTGADLALKKRSHEGKVLEDGRASFAPVVRTQMATTGAHAQMEPADDHAQMTTTGALAQSTLASVRENCQPEKGVEIKQMWE